MTSVLARSLLGLVAALVASGVSLAQDDPEQLFREGVQLLRLNKKEEALQKFDAVLKANPTHEKALQIWKETDQAIWQMLLVQNDEVAKIAKHLMGLARLERKARSRDEGRVAEVVGKVLSKDYDERRTATLVLQSEIGEFAVPALVQKLGDADDDRGQVLAMLGLQNLGRQATLALCAALGHESALVRRNVAAALALIGDDRAAPALARVAKGDTDENVRVAARKSLANLGVAAEANPTDLYVKAARKYLLGGGLEDDDVSDVVWSLDGGKLVFSPVPASVYSLELAKMAAHDALATDPANGDAKALVARAYLAQTTALAESARSEDEVTKAWVARIPSLSLVVSASGPATVRKAVTDAIADGQVPVAVSGIRTLAQIEDRNTIQDSPLAGLLDSADTRIAYAAALALADATGGAGLKHSDKVVRNLGGAVTEESMRVVRVIDGNPEARKVAEASSKVRGQVVEASLSGTKAIGDLSTFPGVDVVVVNENLPDVLAEDVIALIRKDPRMSAVKVLVVAADEEKAKERFGDKIHGVVKGPLSSDNLGAAVTEALKDVPLDANRARANETAVAASESLLRLASAGTDVSGALGRLAEQLNRADAVAIPAAKALGIAGAAGQLGALAEAVLSESASVDLRVAAAGSVGNILGRMPEAPAGVVENMVKLLGGNADARIKAAVVGALGKAKLPAGEQLKLLEMLRAVGAKPAAEAGTEPKG
ncbi:MAG: HEAT repeat domain-containing protein [Planctomycetes bacterium]|nr:HEAT repeat domain-containing protein [Planctomycetota bacterium]